MVYNARSARSLRVIDGERFNGYSHLLGLILSLVGGAFLWIKAAGTGDAVRGAAAAIFVLTLVLLYAASTLYHASQGPAKETWRRADHCAIYLMIAGTYTPFGLVSLGGCQGVAMVGAVWTVALVGVGLESRVREGSSPSLSRYLGMGWLAVLAAVPLVAALDRVAVTWLLAGAACYSLGTVFYRNRRGWRHAHGAWHLFVIGGSASHYCAIRSVVL